EHGASLRPEVRQELVQVDVDLFRLVGVDRRPAVLATDAVAAPAVDAFVPGVLEVNHWKGARHPLTLRYSKEDPPLLPNFPVSLADGSDHQVLLSRALGHPLAG